MIDEKRLIDEIREAINDGHYDRCNPMMLLYKIWDMIEKQPKVGGWILYSEELPIIGEEVEVITSDGERCRGYYDVGWRWYDSSGWKKIDVIAWKERPWEKEV